LKALPVTLAEDDQNVALRLNEKLAKLNEMNLSFNSLTSMMQREQEKFQAMKHERTTRFSECLAKINEGIKRFCELSYSDAITGELKAANESEPFLGQVFFYWRTLKDYNYMIHEMDGNFDAALAFLFGVVQ